MIIEYWYNGLGNPPSHGEGEKRPKSPKANLDHTSNLSVPDNAKVHQGGEGSGHENVRATSSLRGDDNVLFVR
jgi:hypothetical protein